MQESFKLVGPELIARRQTEVRALVEKHAKEDALYKKGTTPGGTGSTGAKDKPIGPHALVDKTDPHGGSSQRSASREGVDRLYEGISDTRGYLQ